MEAIAEVVMAQLKEQFNMGFVYAEQRDYNRAKECFENVLTVCNLVKYEGGKRMAYISLANLYVMLNDPVMSFKMSALAYHGTSDANIVTKAKSIIVKTLAPAMQHGVEAQKAGNIAEAVEIYKLVLPFLKGPKKDAVEREIKKLES